MGTIKMCLQLGCVFSKVVRKQSVLDPFPNRGAFLKLIEQKFHEMHGLTTSHFHHFDRLPTFSRTYQACMSFEVQGSK